ncbi:TLD-domain-containing protein [Myriangium duriaei CBS 260.36]|uniref:Oxidation resistance protein 1 n=1 Tax=Myriangium duriaei CBS 260.36 TaxID=1168546 RepID=A0A9P4JAK2_9PEZI|nr:TLD-domain-containing protein [Myriangium duriaei CBS 260.36]
MSTETQSPQPSSPESSTSSLPPKHPSLFSAFTYPVSYTVSGLIRRISADDAPTPLARALSANYNGSMLDSTYQPPPKRRLSPFQPPPLTPLHLSGWRDSTSSSSRLLRRSLAEEIRLLMPPRLQLVDTWKLVYSLEQNGTSLASLYGICEQFRGKRGGFVLAVRDADGGIFGAYLSDPPHPNAHYYGTGECFLWRCFRLTAQPDLSSLPPPPSEDTTHLGRMTTIADLSKTSSDASLISLGNTAQQQQSQQQGDGTLLSPFSDVASPTSATTPRRGSQPLRFKAFPYTGENDFTILCGQGYLSIGGGNGKYGLWLDDRMARGVSDACPTFDNEPLSESGTKFDVLGVEVWHIG